MKGSAEHSVEWRRDAFNASNGGRLRGRPLFFVAACSVGIKKPGHHTRLHAQMSLSIGSQSTSKRAAIPIPQTLPPACALMLMEGAGEGARVSFAFLRRRVERRGGFNFLDIATQNFN